MQVIHPGDSRLSSLLNGSSGTVPCVCGAGCVNSQQREVEAH